MKHQQILIIIMIIIESASIHLMSRTKLFPLVAIAIALSSLVIQYRFTIDRKTKQRLFVLMVLFFMMKHVVYRPHFIIGRIFIGTPGCLTIAQFLISLQLSLLFMNLKRNYFSIRYAGLGFCLLICTSNYHVNRSERFLNQWIVALFIIAAAYFLHSNRRYLAGNKKSGRIRRQVHMALILSIIVSTSAGTGWAIYRYETLINSVIAKYIPSHSRRQYGGKLKITRLGSVEKQKQTNSEGITLRVYSDDSPGYLRGQIFDKFSGSEWSRTTESILVNPSSTDADTQLNVYELSRVPELADKKYDVWPASGHNEIVYSSLGTTRVKTCLNGLIQDDSGSLWTRQPMEAEPYTVITSKALLKTKIPEKIQHKLLDSGNIDPRIDQIANKIFKDCHSVKDKITAVENYFHDNYQYEMGIEIPSGVHPLVYFLTKRPAAHCEYFASATVILLRTANVSCRYTTGYVVSDQNKLGGYWVAYNKNAHAWVEAYDPDEGWLIVESTPGEGVPSQSKQGQSSSQIYDLLLSWIHKFRINLRKFGLLWVFWKFISVFQYTFISLLTGFILFYAIIKYLKKYRPAGTTRKLSKMELKLNRLLKKMDRQLLRFELRRDPSESLQQFVRRLQMVLAGRPDCLSITGWYQDYLKARFSSNQGEHVLDHLKKSMPVLKS